jgi:hypothetical protein
LPQGLSQMSCIIVLQYTQWVQENISMSLIHWNKSVLSFHLKEIFEEEPEATAPTLIGLGLLMASAIALPTLSQWGKPVAKAAIKTALAQSPQCRGSGEAVEAKFPQSATIESNR